jgi:hypothetical protein
MEGGAVVMVKPGMRLRSAVCDTEVVVVVAREPEVDLRCGGHPMAPVPGDGPPSGLTIRESTGTLLGKRYASDAAGIEVLCTKAGAGGLSLGDDPMPVKAAKPLPSSD